jgi:hypothetical protein
MLLLLLLLLGLLGLVLLGVGRSRPTGAAVRCLAATAPTVAPW